MHGSPAMPPPSTAEAAPGPVSPSTGPLVAAFGLVVDPLGRVLVDLSEQGVAQLPGGFVTAQESPETGLVRMLSGVLGAGVLVGRLLAVDSLPPGPDHRSVLCHLYAVRGPGDLRHTGSATRGTPPPGTHWLRRQEAERTLPGRLADRVRAALDAWHAGSVAHLIEGIVQPGSAAGLAPELRARLEAENSLDPASYVAARPKAVTGAGVLFTDAGGRVLLVQPGYRDDGLWHLPGGGVDSDTGESPRQAAEREVREELALDLPAGRLLAVDWSPGGPQPAVAHFTFDGGTLSERQLASVRIEHTELTQWRLVRPERIHGMVHPPLYARIRAALAARRDDTGPLELHEGMPWPS